MALTGLACAGVLCAPTSARAQTAALDAEQREEQDDLAATHSVLQKTGLATLGLTGASGYVLLMNKRTLFGKGRCADGEPIFGEFGCSGFVYLHAAFAVSTLGLFIAQEVVAGEMPISPYDMGSDGRRDAMAALRGANYALFSVQPVLGLLAAHPEIMGVNEADREDVSAAIRTVHFAVGGTLATTYTVNAALQW